jgi:hypothetical protein
MKKEELKTFSFERCRLGRHHPRYNEIKHLDDIKVGRMFRMDYALRSKPSVVFTPLSNEWGMHNRGMGASFLPIRFANGEIGRLCDLDLQGEVTITRLA